LFRNIGSVVAPLKCLLLVFKTLKRRLRVTQLLGNIFTRICLLLVGLDLLVGRQDCFLKIVNLSLDLCLLCELGLNLGHPGLHNCAIFYRVVV
jgi:hypothetical protein